MGRTEKETPSAIVDVLRLKVHRVEQFKESIVKVDTLFIICVALPSQKEDGEFGDDEGIKGAQALRERYERTGKAKEIHLVKLAPFSYLFSEQVTVVDKNPKIIERVKTSNDKAEGGDGVGVYVIGHGRKDGIHGIKPEQIPAILKHIGVPSPIRKLCLVSCHVGTSHEKKIFEVPSSFVGPDVENNPPGKNYLSACCAWLAMQGYPGIKVAGWDTFVTIGYAGAGSKTVGEKMKKALPKEPTLIGAKAALNSKGKKVQVDPEIRKKSKAHYCWIIENGIAKLAPTTWSDKK